MDNIILVLLVLGVLAIVIHAYNMGWDAGHHSMHEGHIEESEGPTLWK